MLSKCAAPECSERFRYLHSGRLYQFETRDRPQNPGERMPVQAVEFFWLCEECATRLTLDYKQGVGITLISLNEEQRAASAS